MIKTLHAIFDGKVLRPEGLVDLDVGKRYVLIVERTIETKVMKKKTTLSTHPNSGYCY